MFGTEDKWAEVLRALSNDLELWIQTQDCPHPAIKMAGVSGDMSLRDTTAFRFKLIQAETWIVTDCLPRKLWGGLDEIRLSSFVFTDFWLCTWRRIPSTENQDKVFCCYPLSKAEKRADLLHCNRGRRIVHLWYEDEHYECLSPRSKQIDNHTVKTCTDVNKVAPRHRSAEEVYGKRIHKQIENVDASTSSDIYRYVVPF